MLIKIGIFNIVVIGKMPAAADKTILPLAPVAMYRQWVSTIKLFTAVLVAVSQ
jgi:hypothetical protein